MSLTNGELLFYGGILGIVLLSIVSIMLIILYHAKGKKLMKKIQEEF